MHRFKKIGKFDALGLNKVASILNECGKDMARFYGLHHWDNPYLKSFAIATICNLKNDTYLLYDDKKAVATFMIKKNNEVLHFEKLGALPCESGRGIGSLCLKKIEEIAKTTGCKKVIMEVYEPSKHAISFYEHRGYRVVGTIDTLKYKEIEMEKSI